METHAVEVVHLGAVTARKVLRGPKLEDYLVGGLLGLMVWGVVFVLRVKAVAGEGFGSGGLALLLGRCLRWDCLFDLRILLFSGTVFEEVSYLNIEHQVNREKEKGHRNQTSNIAPSNNAIINRILFKTLLKNDIPYQLIAIPIKQFYFIFKFHKVIECGCHQGGDSCG